MPDLSRDLPDPREEPTITIPRAAAIAGVSPATAYRAAGRPLSEGGLPTIKVSGSYRVRTAAFLRMIDPDEDHGPTAA